jgi:hypothetical protein
MDQPMSNDLNCTVVGQIGAVGLKPDYHVISV